MNSSEQQTSEREVVYGAEAIAIAADVVDSEGNPDVRKTYYMLQRGYIEGAKKAGNIWILSIPV